ncbi:MAG TPA: hypothetical protein VGD80_14095 [Kofleriaceae bacterium]
MKKRTRSPRPSTLNQEGLRILERGALAHVQGGTYPATEYDVAPSPATPRA